MHNFEKDLNFRTHRHAKEQLDNFDITFANNYYRREVNYRPEMMGV